MFEQGREQELLENPQIIKPESRELIDKLERKLGEYEERKLKFQEKLNRDPNNKEILYPYNDAFYKAAVLGFLLIQGKVEERDIALSLQDMHKTVDFDLLSSAFKVIKAYVEGGNVSGGSGLK